MNNLPSVLMRPLEDLGFPGYWLSVCGHLYSDHDEFWMTPIPPKKSVEYWHGRERGAECQTSILRDASPTRSRLFA